MKHDLLTVLEKYSTDLTEPLADGAELVSVQIQAHPRGIR
jgi:hypothetical protein